MLRNYFRIAWRIIGRNRLYTLISVLSLSLGICSCIVIWLVAHYEFSFDSFHPGAGRIYRVGNSTNEHKSAAIIPPMPDAIRRTVPGVEAVTTWFPSDGRTPVTVPAAADKPAAQFSSKLEGQERLGDYMIADDNWFSIFPYQWLAGDRGVLRQPFTVVLTENKARQYFGSLPAGSYIGKELIYEDSLRVRVAGIVKDWTGNTELPYSAFISFATIDASFLKVKRHMDDWATNGGGPNAPIWPRCFVKLEKGVKPEQVSASLQVIGRQVVGNTAAHPFRVLLQPLADIHFNADYNDDDMRKAHAPTLYILMAIAVFILILGTVNFVNLSTAQSIQRAKEIGVRKVLGSARSGIMAQFLTETAVITVLSVATAALLVNPVMAWFREYIPVGVHFRPADPVTLSFLAGITVVTTLLAGFYPAKVLAGYLPVQSLKGGEQKGGEKWLLRKGLIVFQFTISLVFIIASLITSRQIRFMLDTNPGFNKDAVITLPFSNPDRMRTLATELRRLPPIADLTLQGHAPMGAAIIDAPVQYEGRKDKQLMVSLLAADEHFLPTYQMHLLAGHNIRPADSANEFLINENYEHALGFQEHGHALGKLLTLNGQSRPIVGVVADFHTASFHQSIRPILMTHIPDLEYNMGIRLRSTAHRIGDLTSTLAQIAAQWKKINPDTPFEYSFLDEKIAALYHQDRQLIWLIDAAMLLTITIACMGLIGLIVFVVERRRREIAVRKVLGADVLNIVGILNGEIIALVTIALLIASPLAWYGMNRWLQDFAYRIQMPWWIFALAGLSAIGIACGTISIQVIRAALANPIKSLRSE